MTAIQDGVTYKAKIVKNGNSLAVKVTFPAKILGLKHGDDVEITLRPAEAEE